MSSIQSGATCVMERRRDAAVPACCPACGQRDTLIALGVRDDHPSRWRPWVTRPTLLALCDRCDALVEVCETTHSTGRARRQPVPSAVARESYITSPHVLGAAARRV